MNRRLVMILPLSLILLFPLIPLLKYDVFLSWSDWRFAGEAAQEEFPNAYPFLLSVLVPLLPSPYHLRFLSPMLLALSALLFSFYLKKKDVGESSTLVALLLLPLVPGFLDCGLILTPATLALPLFVAGLLVAPRPFGVVAFAVLLSVTDPRALLLFAASIVSGVGRRDVFKPSFLLTVLIFLFLLVMEAVVDSSFLAFSPLAPQKIVGGLGYVPLVLALCGSVAVREKSVARLFLLSSLLYAFFGLHPSFVALPISLLGALFVASILPRQNPSSALAFILLFTLSLSAPFFYLDRATPAADDTDTFLFARTYTIAGNMMTGWFYAPISSFITGRPAVSSDERRENVYEKQFYATADPRLLDRLDARYVYFGSHEAYDYPLLDLGTPLFDKMYAGKGGLFDVNRDIVYVVITVDTEPDLPPWLNTYTGIEEGVPRILGLLDEYNVRATFFVGGEIIEKYPDLVRKIAEAHEVGLHGMYHEKFTNLSDSDKESRVIAAMNVYEKVLGHPPSSFRAPGHSADTSLMRILQERGFRVEASATKLREYPYHPSFTNWNVDGEMSILRVPVSHVPHYFYASMLWRQSWPEAYGKALSRQGGKVKIVVIGMHSWEFVTLHAPEYETYTRVCGDYTYGQLRNLLEYLKYRRARYIAASELALLFPPFSEETGAFASSCDFVACVS